MSRFVLLILSLGLLTNEVRCGEIGVVSKFQGALLAKALPPWTRSNLEYPSSNRVSVNSTRKVARAGNTTTSTATRNAKFLPKFSIVAGLDIGGAGLALPGSANLTPLARISQSSSLPGSFKPYFAASYDPFPSSTAVHQSIQALYNLVERLSQQVDHFNKLSNSSAEIIEIIDDRRRRKDKLKVKKSTANKQKKKQQQKIKDEAAEEIDDSEEKVPQKIVNAKSKKSSKSGARQTTSAKQQVVPTNTTDNSMESGETSTTNATMTNSTEPGNYTTQRPGFYYGGNPQKIDNVGFTYDAPHGAYGAPPDNNYGPPSTNYGTPSFAYGPPSYNYGPPSRGYGAPYESAHFTAFSEPVVYEDPNESPFGPEPSPQRWHQRLPFARSRSIGTTTRAPVVANGNGFVPIL